MAIPSSAQLRKENARFRAIPANERDLNDKNRRAIFATMKKCCKSIEVLTSRLEELGYPEPFIGDAYCTMDELTDRLEEEYPEVSESLEFSLVPLSLLAFWKVLEGVSFVDFEDFEHVDFWASHGVKGAEGYCDALHIESFDGYFIESMVEELGEHLSNDEDDPMLVISPDGFHKDNISGGLPYAIEIGPRWDPEVLGFHWSGSKKPESVDGDEVTFMEYLRATVLECAGFPGLLGDEKFEPIRLKLLDGLPLF